MYFSSIDRYILKDSAGALNDLIKTFSFQAHLQAKFKAKYEQRKCVTSRRQTVMKFLQIQASLEY